MSDPDDFDDDYEDEDEKDLGEIPAESVRKRPEMYVGSDGEDGVMHLALEVVANSYDQYLAGRCTKIDLQMDADGTVRVTDDGPGMSVEAAEGRPGLHELLTTISRRPTVDGHKPHAHLGLGGIGLFVVAALSERFEISTTRDGVQARALYSRGRVIEAFVTTPTTSANGTTICYLPDHEIFRTRRINLATIIALLEDLSFLSSALTLSWRFSGTSLAREGLAGRVAARMACSVDEVARYSGTFETPTGPIDVDVALAWRLKSYEGTSIDSFVNLHRTREDGAHVEGLLDGICRFFGVRSRRRVQADLVAAVSVVLADVKFGNPSKDRLDSEEACEPVSEATIRALQAWAAKHPDTAATIRAHVGARATG